MISLPARCYLRNIQRYYLICIITISYTLQSATAFLITKCDGLLLQSATAFSIQNATSVIISATGISKCYDYYKVRQNRRFKLLHLFNDGNDLYFFIIIRYILILLLETAIYNYHPRIRGEIKNSKT